MIISYDKIVEVLEMMVTPFDEIGEVLGMVAAEYRKNAKKVGSVGDEDMPPLPTEVTDMIKQSALLEEGHIPPLPGESADTYPKPDDGQKKEHAIEGGNPSIAKKVAEIRKGWSAEKTPDYSKEKIYYPTEHNNIIALIGSTYHKIRTSLENFIISQKAMKNIMNIEGGVEEKMIEEKESKPEFEQPKTLEEANILAVRYYLRGIGMGDALEQFLQYIKFNEYLDPIAVVPKDKFIEIVNGDNANFYNILKNTDITYKISENVVIDNSRLKTGGSDFSNRYIEENLKYYADDFESAKNKSFSIPNYTALAILVPDALRVKFVKFAQVNESSRELPLVSIVENKLFRDDHMKKESLVPTDAELSEFVYASGEKAITDLLDFLHGLDEQFSQISLSVRHEPALVDKRLKEAVYRNILQKNNPELCYKAPAPKCYKTGPRGIVDEVKDSKAPVKEDPTIPF